MIQEPKIDWHRLTIKAEDIPLYKAGKTMTVRPVKEQGGYNEIMAHYAANGTQWGWAVRGGLHRVYSSETLVKCFDTVKKGGSPEAEPHACYEDDVVAEQGWTWKRARQQAIFQPRRLARFDAALADVEVMLLGNLPNSVFTGMRRSPTEFYERWDQLNDEYPSSSNPYVWVLTLDDFQWKETV